MFILHRLLKEKQTNLPTHVGSAPPFENVDSTAALNATKSKEANFRGTGLGYVPQEADFNARTFGCRLKISPQTLER